MVQDTQKFNQRSTDLTAKWEEAIRQRKADLLLTLAPVEVEMVTMPPVMATRIPLISLVEAGRIPDALTPFVIDLYDKTHDEQKPEEATARRLSLIEERWAEYVKTLNVVWLAAVQAPVFTAANPPPPGELCIDDVALADKIALFNWCQGVTNHLAAFRELKNGAVRLVGDEPSIPEQNTSGTSGDSQREPVAVVATEHGNNALGQIRRLADELKEGSAGQPAATEETN